MNCEPSNQQLKVEQHDYVYIYIEYRRRHEKTCSRHFDLESGDVHSAVEPSTFAKSETKQRNRPSRICLRKKRLNKEH